MDGRFNLKVKFSIYGEDFDWDCSLNWSGYDGEIDERITEWFKKCHNVAKAKFDHRVYELEREHREKEQKRFEIEQLKMLREKYPEI